MRYHVLVLILCACAESANILGIFPLPSRSHFVMFERLLKHLADRGHNVDIASHFPLKEPPPPRYNELSLVGSLPILVNNLTFDTFKDFSHYDIVHFMVKLMGVDGCEATLKSPALQNVKNSKKKYDLVLTEIFGSDCMLGFGHLFDAPTISLTSSTNLPWGTDRIGNPDNPSYIPTYFTPSIDKMSLYERLQNTLYLISSKFLYDYLSSKESNRIAKEFFGPDLPSLEDLAKNTSLILVNSHFSMNYVRPALPNFVEVGGLHISDPKPLSPHFENLLRTDSRGIIYLTMGSMMMTETFDPEKLQGMFDAFAELPYKVLWKADREKFPKGLKMAENIHFEKWMPQLDILCHPNVKLFISHGGLMGSQEAVYCGVPRLGIPIFADQDNNIRSSEKQGLSIKVAYEDITKETILAAAKKLLLDPKYKQNAEYASKKFRDRPMSALDTATYWVEYVIRHRGAPHLRSAGADLLWYQYYLLDVGLILISVFFTVLYMIILVLRVILKIIGRLCKEKLD